MKVEFDKKFDFFGILYLIIILTFIRLKNIFIMSHIFNNLIIK